MKGDGPILTRCAADHAIVHLDPLLGDKAVREGNHRLPNSAVEIFGLLIFGVGGFRNYPLSEVGYVGVFFNFTQERLLLRTLPRTTHVLHGTAAGEGRKGDALVHRVAVDDLHVVVLGPAPVDTFVCTCADGS